MDVVDERLERALSRVRPLDPELAGTAQAHLDNLTKPRGSLGRLEELAVRLFQIQGGPPAADPARVCTIAGDHGVAAEGVSLFPQEVTRQMVLNFVGGGAAINVLTRTAGIDLQVVDAGVAGPDFDPAVGLVRRKVAPGTASIAKGPAMSRAQCLDALALGIDLADGAAADGCRVLGTGDMGIANTTPSTALFCAFLGLDPETVTGPGTGLDPEGVRRKAAVVAQALAANRPALKAGDPVGVLAALGGYEIAALAGLVIGAAANRMAVAVDGFISTAAALSAIRICPDAAQYCVFSHASAEPGYLAVTRAMNVRPLLHLEMRLGEGTGSAVAIFLLRSACAIFNEMASFADAGVSQAEE